MTVECHRYRKVQRHLPVWKRPKCTWMHNGVLLERLHAPIFPHLHARREEGHGPATVDPRLWGSCLKGCCAHQRTEGGERQLRRCTGPHDVARQMRTSESDTRGTREHQGLAFVPYTTNTELRMGAEDALIFRFPTWSGSSRSTHARRKRRISEGVAGTFCEPTTSMQTKLWTGWRGKELAAGPLRC